MALELGRGEAARLGAPPAVLALAGAGLGAVALAFPASALGLSVRSLPLRLLGGIALAVALLLPAAVRIPGLPMPSPGYAIALSVIAAGEEIGFRGALYAALESAFGPLAAVVGSAALFTAGHALSHPPQFLAAVAAAGLLLAAWRWACRDLVGPVVGHVLADLAI
jgi:membrane protease YdiL (CAAX protease family)